MCFSYPLFLVFLVYFLNKLSDIFTSLCKLNKTCMNRPGDGCTKPRYSYILYRISLEFTSWIGIYPENRASCNQSKFQFFIAQAKPQLKVNSQKSQDKSILYLCFWIGGFFHKMYLVQKNAVHNIEAWSEQWITWNYWPF